MTDGYVYQLLKSQSEEINILLEKLEQQETEMSAIYKNELKEIENALAQVITIFTSLSSSPHSHNLGSQ